MSQAPSDLKLGVAQLTSTDRTQENLIAVLKFYGEAVEGGAHLVVFPENTLFFRIRGGDSVQGLSWPGPEALTVQTEVDRQRIPLLLTTPLNVPGSSRPHNATLLFEPGKAPQKVYSKVHMFDVDVEGAPPVRESAGFTRGDGPRLIDVGGWRVGLSICYDLRFAELYRSYAQNADLILVPSAFLQPTGDAHWHVLLRARAIEAQCFVAAPAQSGVHRSHDSQRKTYGHSLVVDPWGRVLLDQTATPSVAIVNLEHDLIAKVRRQIPMADHRQIK